MSVGSSLSFYAFILILLIPNALYPSLASSIILYLLISCAAVLLCAYERISIDPRRGFLLGSSLATVLISIAFIVGIISGGLKILGVNPSILLIPAFLFQSLVAVGEELSFRGYILASFVRSTGGGIIASSIMFAGIHIPGMVMMGMGVLNGAVMFATLTTAGILLALLCIRWGIGACIGFHLFWNFMQYHIYSMGRRFEGLQEMLVTAYSNDLISGGTCRFYYCGPEASVVGLAVMLAGVIIVYLLGRR